jgi:hypothetical protein
MRRPLGRPRHGWEGNIGMDHKEDVRVWTGFIWLRIWLSVAGFCEYGT